MVGYLLLAAIGSGLFTGLLIWMMGNPIEGPVKTGRMFSWIGEFFRVRYLEGEKRIDIERNRRMQEEFERHQQLHPGVPIDKFKAKAYHKINWWKMPICPRCMNAWQAIIGLLVFVFIIGISPWWLLAVTLYMGFADLGCLVSSRLTA